MKIKFLSVTVAILLTAFVFNKKTHVAKNNDFRGFPLSSSSLNDDFIDAVDLLKRKKNATETIPELISNEREILSIVFPEILRWNAFQDLIESQLDENIYVLYGRADFSIGLFQMKPSFIEQLETYVTKHTISSCDFIEINKKNASECRQERIKRLKQNHWQLKYAYVFWKVALHRFEKIPFKTSEERIHFFATAFNYGFLKPPEEIRIWEKRKAFPYGTKYRGIQDAYGDFAVAYYLLNP